MAARVPPTLVVGGVPGLDGARVRVPYSVARKPACGLGTVGPGVSTAGCPTVAGCPGSFLMRLFIACCAGAATATLSLSFGERLRLFDFLLRVLSLEGSALTKPLPRALDEGLPVAGGKAVPAAASVRVLAALASRTNESAISAPLDAPLSDLGLLASCSQF